MSKVLYLISVEERYPDKYGKYLVRRKDGKEHLETWNNLGFAYNHKVITHWYSETPPPELVKLLKRLIPNHIGIPANENYLTPQDITLLNELLN